MEKRLDAIAWWGQQTATRAEAYGTWGIKARILDQRWIFSWSVCAFIIVFNKGDSLSGWHNGTISRFESDSLRIYIWLQCKFVVSLFRLGSPQRHHHCRSFLALLKEGQILHLAAFSPSFNLMTTTENSEGFCVFSKLRQVTNEGWKASTVYFSLLFLL